MHDWSAPCSTEAPNGRSPATPTATNTHRCEGGTALPPPGRPTANGRPESPPIPKKCQRESPPTADGRRESAPTLKGRHESSPRVTGSTLRSSPTQSCPPTRQRLWAPGDATLRRSGRVRVAEADGVDAVQSPVVPSRSSRRMSRCPLWRAFSSTRWCRIQRRLNSVPSRILSTAGMSRSHPAINASCSRASAS